MILNNKTRTAAILCAFLAIGSATMTACGDAATVAKTETQPVAESTAVTEAETEEPIILDALPADIDLGGREIRVYLDDCDQTQYDVAVFMMGPDEADGDIVHDAILERNQLVEERLNCTFTYEIVEHTYDQVYSPLQKIIMAGDDVYDLLVEQQYGLLKVAADNMLYNFYDNGINDFSQNYWWEEYMEQLSIGLDSRYIVAGDYFLDIVETASAIFFNKNMFNEEYENAEELYDLAFDGKWTIDALGVYIKEFYRDVNGNGTADDGDIFSMNLSRNYMDAQSFGSGIVFMTRDDNGLPVLNLTQEAIATMMEKVNENYFIPDTTFNFSTGVSNEIEYYQNQRKSFSNRELLFLNDYLAAVKDLRDMKDDYGILPIPKYDESVESYRSVAHDTALVGAIPTTCGDPASVCMVLEALCSMSHNTAMKTYFESAMKVKYARDERSSQMIDLLHDSITSNFLYAFGPQLNSYYEIFRTLFDSQSAEYASKYAKMEKTVNKKMDKLIETYLESKQQ